MIKWFRHTVSRYIAGYQPPPVQRDPQTRFLVVDIHGFKNDYYPPFFIADSMEEVHREITRLKATKEYMIFVLKDRIKTVVSTSVHIVEKGNEPLIQDSKS